MKKFNINIKVVLTLLLFVAAWAYWTLVNDAVLNYQEETQMFLFDSEQFMERIAVPAGFARYIAEFFVQMFYVAWIGGFVIAVFYSLLQVFTWLLVKNVCRSSVIGYVLSFVPVILLWFYMGDIKMKFTFVVALMIAELAMLGAGYLYQLAQSDTHKKILYVLYILIVAPVVAWIAGPVVLVFGIYMALLGLNKPTDFTALLSCVYSFACLIMTGLWAVAPTERLFYGVGYSMVVNEFPVMQYIVMLFFAIMPWIITKVPEFKNKNSEINTAKIAAGVLAVTAFALVCYSRNSAEIEVLQYDKLVRTQQWEKIIEKARQKSPDTPLTVTSLNLALAMTGQLLNHGFDFYQNGWAGAFPKFNKIFEVSLLTSDVYFFVGLINTAQRLNFEAREALPDNASSPRVVKRLAETNIINGQYNVARRYLHLLEKTMFYSDWAYSTEALLGNEKAVNAHPLYGQLRKLRLTTNEFTFSDDEIDKMMGQLLIHNPDNMLAMEYLLFLPQLEGNQQKFGMYMNFVKTHCKNALNSAPSNR